MPTIAHWTLDELVDQVAGALASGYGGQSSGRVRDLPDRRAVRYYTTLGLVDRPSGWRGRVALYGERHLLQLTAIKRLQALGLTLAEVQRELTGCDDATLRRLGGLPAATPAGAAADQSVDQMVDHQPVVAPPALTPSPSPGPGRAGDGAARSSVDLGSARQARQRFWTAQDDSADDQHDTTDERKVRSMRAGAGARTGMGAGGSLDGAAIQGVGLAPGVVLLVEGAPPLSGEELAAVRAAAGPLLAAIRRLGLQGLHRLPEPPPAQGAGGTADEPASGAPSRAPLPREGDDE